MPVPAYHELIQPLLKILAIEGEELSKARLVDLLATELRLGQQDVLAKLPSGTGTLFEHHIDWARSHLQLQGLIEGSLERGMRLTARGWDIAGKTYPQAAQRRYLQTQSTDRERVTDRPLPGETGLADLSDAENMITPDETAALNQIKRLNDELGLALIHRICRQSPTFFETLVIDLLVAMGYGRAHRDLARKLGRTGDGGVDGFVAMDELGIDSVYVQAKRYRPEAPVPISAVRDFVGSLDAKRSSRGVFFTTSFFPASAHDYVSHSTFRVVLVGGRQLAGLMMRHNIGVRVKDEIKIRRIDESYFAM
ncbi:MAG TPA: restriction endonuclease [Aestuariivirgaceae bacterium]